MSGPVSYSEILAAAEDDSDYDGEAEKDEAAHAARGAGHMLHDPSLNCQFVELLLHNVRFTRH